MSTGSIAGGGTGFRKRKRATVEETVGGGDIDYTSAAPSPTGGTTTDPVKPTTTTDVLGKPPKKPPTDPYKDPKTVDKILNPLSGGTNKPPLIHVAPSPLKGPNEFNPNAGGTLAPGITGVPTGGAKTGIGPTGVPVYVGPPPPSKGKTTLNPALTGVSDKEVKKSPTEYGKGPNGENVHKAPSPTQGSKPGKQSLSSTVFASPNMPASASGKNVLHVKTDSKGNVKGGKDDKGKSTVTKALDPKQAVKANDNKGKANDPKKPAGKPDDKKPATKSDNKPATKPDDKKPSTKPDTKPATKPDNKQTKPVSDPGKDKPKAKPDSKPAPKADNKPTPKPAVKDSKNDNKGKDNKKDDKKDNKSMSKTVVKATGGGSKKK